MSISMLKCQTRLMLVWVIGCVLLLLVAWLQIINGHYGENGTDVWQWLLPSISPTLSLVVGVWTHKVLIKRKDTQKVSKGLYRIVFFASIVYLGFIGAIFAIQPMVARPPLDVIRNSTILTAALQSVMCAFIGIFFTQSSK